MEIQASLRLFGRSLFPLCLLSLLTGFGAALFARPLEPFSPLGLGLSLLAWGLACVALLTLSEAALLAWLGQIFRPPLERLLSLGLCVLLMGLFVFLILPQPWTGGRALLSLWLALWAVLAFAMEGALLRRLGRGLQPVLVGLGAVVLGLILAEVSLRAHNALNPPADSPLPEVAQVNLDPQAYNMITDTPVDWAYSYWIELLTASARFDWMPYVYWRMRAFDGEYINVDERGLRATRASQAPPALTIHLFGGSTLWGYGARDAHTIPSELVRALETGGLSAEAVNYGEIGYVARQDATLFQMNLANGVMPDVAVFYWGFNDINVAYSEGFIGVTGGEKDRAARFEGVQCVVDFSIPTLFNGLMYKSEVGRRFMRWQKRPPINPAEGCALGNADWTGVNTRLATLSGNDPQALADYLLALVRQTRAIGEAYGVRTLFIWQPTLFRKDPLSWYEGQIVAQKRWRDLGDYYLQVDAALMPAWTALPDAYDAGAFFSGLDKTINIYIDKVHITEEGNALVAAWLADVLLAP
jgi:lysophospholipase L1-like esterase